MLQMIDTCWIKVCVSNVSGLNVSPCLIPSYNAEVKCVATINNDISAQADKHRRRITL